MRFRPGTAFGVGKNLHIETIDILGESYLKGIGNNH
jgi:hypothetical protein